MSSKWKEVVEKLLRKAEDPASSEEERETYLEKATILMAKFGIEEALLFSKENRTEKVERRDFTVVNPYKLKKEVLINGISIAFGCMAVRMIDGKTVRVIGFPDDLEKVYVLYSSLLIQMIIALSQAEKPEGIHGKTFSDSFLKGFVHIVLKRVRDAYKKAKDEVARVSTGTDLVLRNRKEMVVKSAMEEFPHLRTKSSTSRVRSGDAYSLGRNAGYNANIGQAQVGFREKGN